MAYSYPEAAPGHIELSLKIKSVGCLTYFPENTSYIVQYICCILAMQGVLKCCGDQILTRGCLIMYKVRASTTRYALCESAWLAADVHSLGGWVASLAEVCMQAVPRLPDASGRTGASQRL